MQAITSRPEMESVSTDPARAVPTSPSHADVALAVAILGPVAVVGLLVLIGVSVGAAVCAAFVIVFVVTTTLDVRWLVRRRRSRNDLHWPAS